MKILLQSKNGNIKQAKAHHLNIKMVAIVAFLLFITTLLLLIGARFSPSLSKGASHDPEIKIIVAEQRDKLEKTRTQIDANLDALTQRVGLLQAHINRLNALGDKLVVMASINTEEFNFMDVPAIGGPQESELQGYGSTEITKALELLELQLLESEQKLSALDGILMQSELQNEIKPQGRPVIDGWMSSSYGYRNDPFSGRRQFHKGVDFAGAKNTPVFAVAGGIVIRAEKSAGYGNLVEIDHGNGYITRYGHSSTLHVKPGDVVKKGKHIADMGSTGRSTGPHVHFEVIKEGRHINPSAMIKDS